MLSIQAIMCHSTDRTLSHGSHQYPVFLRLGQELHGLFVCQPLLLSITDRKIDDIGNDPFDFDLNLWVVSQPMGELLAVLVILGQAFYHLFEGHNASRSDHASLPHTAP